MIIVFTTRKKITGDMKAEREERVIAVPRIINES